jgi:cation:H+ antiporter
VLIYLVAEPFLGSVLAVASTLGLAPFVAIKWIAPFVSEFPEKVSALQWARKPEGGASMALMNMVSSNINQWTLLAAMLPIVLSISRHSASGLVFDQQQSLELLMTLGQALLGCLFLIAMELVWWEALAIFALWVAQFLFSIAPRGVPMTIHWVITGIYLAWSAVEVIRIVFGFRAPVAFVSFARAWHTHVRARR